MRARRVKALSAVGVGATFFLPMNNFALRAGAARPAVPHLIHMVFFPWDRNQKLLADCHDFDHEPYEQMVQYAPDFEVRLWTLDKARDLCDRECPDIWTLIESAPKPMMMVDLLRWHLLWRFGGIYWQYDFNPLTRMDDFLPSEEKRVRLFTEFVLTDEQRSRMAKEPIRNGEPEERIRVLNQVFSGEPGHMFFRSTVELIAHRMRHCEMKRDYDLLYISANAAVSTSYDRHGKDDASVELLPRETMRSMIKVTYKGTWRTDMPVAAAVPVYPVKRNPGIRLRQWPPVARHVYRWLTRHAHEDFLRGEEDGGTAVPSGLADLLRKHRVRSVLHYPCRRSGVEPCDAWAGFRYAGGDPCREITMDNRGRYRRKGCRFIHINLLYSRIPAADCLVLGNAIERIPEHELRTILRRIKASGIRLLVLPTHPLLNSNWDTALGDPRPLNVALSPYRLPAPDMVVPAAGKSGRPDRVLGVWLTSRLGGNL